MEENKTTNRKNTNNKGSNNKVGNNRKNSSGNNNSNKQKTSLSNNAKSKSKIDKTVDDIELLDKTNSFDIIIDDDRLKDKESLDFSFIDGKGKKKKAKKEIEILDDIDYKAEAKKLEDDVSNNKSNDVFSTSLVIIFSFVLGFLICFIWAKESNYFIKSKTVVEEIEKVVVDDNYVFVGDSIFAGYALDEHFKGMPTVNSGVSGDKTVDVLKNLNYRIYRYNPSKVILLIGTNDIGKLSSEETVSNIGKIIDEIKENREHAEIYVQSIYPVNDDVDGWKAFGDRDNDTIQAMNKDIKKLCKDKKVTFMNVYDYLTDDDGNLSEDYSYDGLHLSEEGYKVVTKEVMKILK